VYYEDEGMNNEKGRINIKEAKVGLACILGILVFFLRSILF
jgi:hypothetical protein